MVDEIKTDGAVAALASSLAAAPSAASVPPEAVLDFATLDLTPGAENGSELELVHPVTGKKLGVFLDIIGADADTYRNNLRRVRDQVAAAVQAEPRDEESRVRLALARGAACAVRGWRTGDTKTIRFQGSDLPYDFESAVMVFSQISWMADQVGAYRDQRANFFKP